MLALDGLRGFGIAAVVTVHITYLVIPHVKAWLLPGGFLALDIFFVQSGFFITTLLLEEQLRSGGIRLGRFYARRAYRLLPALVVYLAACFLYTTVTRQSLSDEASSTAYVLLYLTNWASAFGVVLAVGVSHLWSLAVEEQFYALWPVVTLFVLTVRTPRRVVFGVLGGLVVAVMVHRALLSHDGVSWTELYVRTDTRADSLLIGAALADLRIRGMLPPTRWVTRAGTVAAVVLVLSMLTVARERTVLYMGGLTAAALCAAVLVAAAIDPEWHGGAALCWRPLRLLGRVSYGVYLWHFLVIAIVVDQMSDAPGIVKVATVIGGTAAAAAASWHWVEQPFQRLKERRTGRRYAMVTAKPEVVVDS